MSYESGVADARARKAAKYHDLVEAGRAAGYRVKLFNVVVGSRGMLGDADFDLLRLPLIGLFRDKLILLNGSAMALFI